MLQKIKNDQNQENEGDLADRKTVDFFGSNKEILFAVLLQNMLHPHNNNRTQAIKAGTYFEIETEEQARDFTKSIAR